MMLGTMPGSLHYSFALFVTLQACGVATAYSQHMEYVEKLNELSKSPAPELSEGRLSNEVFSIETGNSFTDLLHSETSFKYYTTIDLVRYPNGIYAAESDRLVIKTQEVLLENDLSQMVNDDLDTFLRGDLNLTQEIMISEFRVEDKFDVLFWEGSQPTVNDLERKLFSFHIRGPKIHEGTSFSDENYITWLHLHLYFESENGTMSFDEARNIIESINFLETMNIPFELEERTSITATYPLYSKDPRWYNSSWFGTYYDSTKGWLFHEYLGWVYTEGSLDSGVWFWHKKLGWFWTKDSTYPYIYSQYTSGWLFLDLNSLKPKRYYDFAIPKWVSFSEPNIDVLLDELMRSNFGSSDPHQLEKMAIEIISNSDLPKQEANKRIAQIMLYGL